MIDNARMRWRCRRGMKELDALLEPFAESHLNHLSSAEQAAFAALLDQPDPRLAAWLLRGETPENPEFADLVTQILSAAHPAGRSKP